MTYPRYLPLWPSASERWLNCTGASRVQLVANAGRDVPSIDAVKGTLKHAMLAGLLTAEPMESFLDPEKNAAEIQLFRDNPDILDADDIEAVQGVAESVKMACEIGGYWLHVEQSYFLGFKGDGWHHKMRCKIDMLLVRDDHILVIDYKGGTSPVDVEGNSQLLTYAVAARGALTYTRPMPQIDVGIYQPQGGRSKGLQIATLSSEILDLWWETLKAGVARNYQTGRPEYVPGPWCEWCPGARRGMCPRVLQDSIELATLGPTDDIPRGSEPFWMLDFEDQIRAALKGLGDLATEMLKAGDEVPGWMLTQVSGNRKWIDPKSVPRAMAERFGGSPEDYQKVQPPKPLTFAEADKIARRGKQKIDDLFEKPTFPKRVRAEEGMESMVELEPGFSSVE
jgi:hypothetical protein